MVTDATKKLREPVAYILLAFAGLVALASLIRLFVGGAGFTAAAGGVQGTLTPPGLTALTLAAALVAAVWLVSEAGERTANARTVALAALVIIGVIGLLCLVTAFAGFGETSTAGLKIVSFIYALGGLALYGAAGLYILKTFQTLPAPVRAPKPGSQGQFAGQQGQYGGQYGAPQGNQYGGAQQAQPTQQYGAYGNQYGQAEQGAGQYGAFGAGAAAGAGAGAVGGYAAAQQGEQQWPQEQSWNQGEQQAWAAGEGDARQGAGDQQAWSAAEAQGAEPTQQWSPEGQQWAGQEQGQVWPQEQQQWSGADAGQQQWAGQEQYGQQVQPEWQGQHEQAQHEQPLHEQAQHEAGQHEAAAQGEQAWSEQSWQQGQTWPAEDSTGATAADVQAQPEPEAADETRVEPRVADTAKDDDQPQQPGGQGGQPGQQGWWSQPS
ncbi:hypothetical protein Kfla_1588 [Kribbella flavida DSM 17836]|uniref:Uncharacterized protein n=1 Tax=Kribbella flavida (strain DSM 17836 / JCM 10339 / NBRC 14399) TaxID=479435 RepID=D2PME0_KRIFD|nr:hypothetical protein [Kribbella flavida]ADB30684.1 hypothetical protein Kfla_1588 [Kribbella flavida DSM 17836]